MLDEIFFSRRFWVKEPRHFFSVFFVVSKKSVTPGPSLARAEGQNATKR